jgi:undecaprenyl-diphosphatase
VTATGGIKQAPSRSIGLVRRIACNIKAWIATLFRPPRISDTQWRPLWPFTGRLALGAAVSILILVVSMILFDAWAITQARALPVWITHSFDQITDFGKSGWFLWPIGLVLLVLAAVMSPALPRFTQLVLATLVVRFGFLFIAIGLPGLFGTVVKRLIGRARPFVGGVADPFLYAPFGWSPAYASLPSGHATTSFAAAVAIGALWPRARPLLWVYALVIAVSRVVVTAHHPSDVIAGAILGVVGALLIRSWFAARRLGFVLGPDGKVRARPGPSWRRIKKVALGLIAQ